MSSVKLALNKFHLNHKTDLEGDYPDFASDTNPVKGVRPGASNDHIIPNLPPILNQLEIGSCAANAGAGALEILLNNEGALKYLSRLHLYWIARALDGTTGDDAGTYLSSICQQMHKIGVCEEKVWSYDPTVLIRRGSKRLQKYLCPPPIESDVRASENRVSGYYKITSRGQQRLNDIAAAIRADHPVIFGTEVGNDFMNTDGKTPVRPDPTDLQGGHATCLVGVQTVAGRMSFRDKNSWGTEWADQGYCWLDQDYMTWSYTDDIWVITRMDPLK